MTTPSGPDHFIFEIGVNAMSHGSIAHNLGLLYIDMQRQAHARELLGETLNLYRDLTSTNPAVYTARVESVTKLLAEPRASSSSAEGH
jgi:hypothetical protein